MIILDMDMPKSCADCRINTDGNGRCGLINSSCMYFAGHNTKPVYCPIKALWQEPCDDTISRQATVEFLEKHAETYEDVRVKMGFKASASLINNRNNLPSVTPQPRWIPCAEKLPEEHEWIGTKRFGTTISDEVYVTFETLDGQRFCEHCRFQNGEISLSKRIEVDAISKGAKPVAWCELPQPWKGDKE